MTILTAFFAVFLIAFVRAAPACVTGRGNAWFAFNAGGESIRSLNFATENPDYFQSAPGNVYTTGAEIYTCPGCGEDEIFESERFTREKQLVYAIPVPNGVYTVVTMHAEIYHNAVGKRKFHIEINDARMRSNLDVFADANGKNKGIKLEHHNIKAIDRVIRIAFIKSVENPQVSGIIIKGKGAPKYAVGCCDRRCPKSLKPKGKTSDDVLPEMIDVNPPELDLEDDDLKLISEETVEKGDDEPVVERKGTPKHVKIPTAPSKNPKPAMKDPTELCILKQSEDSKQLKTKPSSNKSNASVKVTATPIPSKAKKPTPKPLASKKAAPVIVTAIPIPSRTKKTKVEPVASSGGCGDGKYIFCEDFDDLQLGKTERTGKWILDGKASIAVSPGRKSKALYLDPSGAGGEKGRLIVKRGISAPGNSMHGRLRVWVKEFATEPPYAHFVMAEVFKADSGGGEAEGGTEKLRPVGGQFVPGSGSLWGVGADGGATGDWTQNRKTAPTVDGKWVCVEWSMMAKNSEIKVWLDGVAKPEMTVDVDQHDGGHGKLVFPKFDSAWFGWWLFQGNAKPAKFDVYMDDIALAETRIGC